MRPFNMLILAAISDLQIKVTKQQAKRASMDENKSEKRLIAKYFNKPNNKIAQ